MGSHQFVNLAESKELEHLDTTNMKNLARIIPVGTTVPKSCAHVLRTKFPGVEIQNVYAQTESGFLAWSSSLEKLGTIPPGVTIKVFIIIMIICNLPICMRPFASIGFSCARTKTNPKTKVFVRSG